MEETSKYSRIYYKFIFFQAHQEFVSFLTQLWAQSHSMIWKEGIAQIKQKCLIIEIFLGEDKESIGWLSRIHGVRLREPGVEAGPITGGLNDELGLSPRTSRGVGKLAMLA